MPVWLVLAFVFMLILKLCGIAIAWWVVFLPIILLVLAVLGYILFFLGIAALIARAFKKNFPTEEDHQTAIEKKNGLR